jgi:zinc transport system substrate-binding protein
MTNKLLFLILILSSLVQIEAKPRIIVTSSPIDAIISEITGNEAEIVTLVSPGSSPHTYSPRPSQVSKSEKADVLFYVSDYLDGWAANLNTKKKIKIIDLLQKKYQLPFSDEDEHQHGHNSHNDKNEKKAKHKKSSQQVIDPHFWTDPICVKSIVDTLTNILINISPEKEKQYKSNSKLFIAKLEDLHKEIAQKMKNFKGENIFLFHPSFRYFLKRYELTYAGSIEPSPGKEPSADFILKLVKKIKSQKAKALYTEPQLPVGPAKTIAEAASLKLYTLDPIGGVEGRKNYFDLMRYNTNTFIKSLK